MKRKGLKKAAGRTNGAALVKARRVREDNATARRLAVDLEREAKDLQRAAALLRRRAG